MSKLSKSESGQLWAKIFSENCKLRKIEAEEVYYQNPKLCPVCHNSISFKNKSTSTFCSRSCAATHNNLSKIKHPKKLHRSRVEIREEKINDIENGLVSSRRTLKTYLSDKFGYECSECNLSKWRDKILPLEIDHTDGDASNNSLSNIRLLCPNCHSITTTWKGRNKGNGRKSKGLPLY
jgi:hypothetical protein